MRKTKLLLLTLTLAASITACGSDNKNTETDNNKASETQTTQQAAETTTEKSKVGAYKYKITEKDSAGNILSESFYMDSTQKLVEYIKYNAAGKVIEEAEYREDNGELIELIKYSADGSKEEYRESCEWSDFHRCWHKKSIYELGILKELHTLNADGETTSKESYTDGLITEYVSYSDGKELFKDTYKYTSDGKILEEVNYKDGKESAKTTYQYEADGSYTKNYVAGDTTITDTYDSAGAWTKRVNVSPEVNSSGDKTGGTITRTYDITGTKAFLTYKTSLSEEVTYYEYIKYDEYQYDSYVYFGDVKKPLRVYNAEGFSDYIYYDNGAIRVKSIYYSLKGYVDVTFYDKNGGIIKRYPDYPQKEYFTIDELLERHIQD